MKGTTGCNTTRDYIKSAVFMANTAITLATFTVGYAGNENNDYVHLFVDPCTLTRAVVLRVCSSVHRDHVVAERPYTRRNVA